MTAEWEGWRQWQDKKDDLYNVLMKQNEQAEGWISREQSVRTEWKWDVHFYRWSKIATWWNDLLWKSHKTFIISQSCTQIVGDVDWLIFETYGIILFIVTFAYTSGKMVLSLLVCRGTLIKNVNTSTVAPWTCSCFCDLIIVPFTNGKHFHSLPLFVRVYVVSVAYYYMLEFYDSLTGWLYVYNSHTVHI